MQAPSKFEASVLTWISERCNDPALRAQLAEVGIQNREYTVVGCYSTLRPRPGAPVSTQPYSERGPLKGPEFEADAVEFGGGTLLWFEQGRPKCLEIFVYGDYFPEDHRDLVGFRLVSPLPESSK